jgi:hypothetical protein
VAGVERFGDVGRGEFDCCPWENTIWEKRREEGSIRTRRFEAIEAGLVDVQAGVKREGGDLPIAFFPCPDLLLPYPGF